MIRHINQHALACDKCGAIFDDRPRRIGNILEKARNAGWFAPAEHGWHYCPACNPEGSKDGRDG